MPRTLACLLLAAACACAGPGGAATSAAAPRPGARARYHAAGQAAGGGPLYSRTLAGGVEYQLVSAARSGGAITVERVLTNHGEDPVRLDLGRARLRTPAGDELGLTQACAGSDCREASAARGQVIMLDPGATLRLRAEFGPVAADQPIEAATLVDEGIYVAGKLALVAVELAQD